MTTPVKTPRTVFVALLMGGHAARMGDLFRHWADGLFTLPPQLERALDRLGEVQDMHRRRARPRRAGHLRLGAPSGRGGVGRHTRADAGRARDALIKEPFRELRARGLSGRVIE